MVIIMTQNNVSFSVTRINENLVRSAELINEVIKSDHPKLNYKTIKNALAQIEITIRDFFKEIEFDKLNDNFPEAKNKETSYKKEHVKGKSFIEVISELRDLIKDGVFAVPNFSFHSDQETSDRVRAFLIEKGYKIAVGYEIDTRAFMQDKIIKSVITFFSKNK
jgi:hypothetical protein